MAPAGQDVCCYADRKSIEDDITIVVVQAVYRRRDSGSQAGRLLSRRSNEQEGL